MSVYFLLCEAQHNSGARCTSAILWLKCTRATLLHFTIYLLAGRFAAKNALNGGSFMRHSDPTDHMRSKMPRICLSLPCLIHKTVMLKRVHENPLLSCPKPTRPATFTHTPFSWPTPHTVFTHTSLTPSQQVYASTPQSVGQVRAKHPPTTCIV